MTNQEKIQFITERCIKANPDIKKLEFGCKIVINTPERYAEYKESDDEKTTATVLFYQEVSNFDENDVHFMVWLDEWNETFDASILDETDIKIIGRPIRLADVLLAIQQEGWSDQNPMWSEETTLKKKKKLCKKWTLKKDNLQDQSPETIDFIYSLLTKES